MVIFTQFGSEASAGIGALGVDGKAFVIQLITFVLAFFVLKKWAFGPIIRMMDERRRTIESGVSLGEKMRKDQAEMEAKVDAKLHEARQKADEIIASAEETSRQVVRDGEEKAKSKAASIIKEGKARVETEATISRKKLESELVGLVAEATEVILGEKVDAKKDGELIDKAIKGAKV